MFIVICVYLVGSGVDVYILDTGINRNHVVFLGEDGSSRAMFSYDQFGGRGETDCQGHGTHCAGLAVGRLTGAAYGARVFR